MRTTTRPGLLQRVTTAYPWMLFLSRSRSSSSIDGGKKKLRSRSSSEENLSKLSDFKDNDLLKLWMEFPQSTDLLREYPELFCLTNAYFTTTKAVSELCQSVEKYLEKYLERVEQHDECPSIDDLLCGISASGCEDFLRSFRMFHIELITVMVKLMTRVNEIEKKLKRGRGPRAIIAAFTTCGTSRRKRSTAEDLDLEGEKTAVASMITGTMVAITEVGKALRLLRSLIGLCGEIESSRSRVRRLRSRT